MNYETWKINYKRPDKFDVLLNGEGFEYILHNFFDEKSFSFYLMAEKLYMPIHLLHGFLISTNGNFTPLFRTAKNELEKKYGEVDFIFGTSDQFGQYVLFFSSIHSIDKIRTSKLDVAKSGLYRTCSSFCDMIGGNNHE